MTETDRRDRVIQVLEVEWRLLRSCRWLEPRPRCGCKLINHHENWTWVRQNIFVQISYYWLCSPLDVTGPQLCIQWLSSVYFVFCWPMKSWSGEPRRNCLHSLGHNKIIFDCVYIRAELLDRCEAISHFDFLVNSWNNSSYVNVHRFHTWLWLVGRRSRTSLVARWRAYWTLNWLRALSGLGVLQRSMPSNRWNWKTWCLVGLLYKSSILFSAFNC